MIDPPWTYFPLENTLGFRSSRQIRSRYPVEVEVSRETNRTVKMGAFGEQGPGTANRFSIFSAAGSRSGIPTN